MSRHTYERPQTGRSFTRHRYVCESCGIRKAIGEPKANDLWPQRLNLSQEQVNALLVAAKEFEDMCEEAGVISNAVDCIDWLSVDALRRDNASPVVLRGKAYRQERSA